MNAENYNNPDTHTCSRYYGSDNALAVIGNCDHCLLLGCNDVDTARYFSIKANTSLHRILDMSLDSAWLFERGKPQKTNSETDNKNKTCILILALLLFDAQFGRIFLRHKSINSCRSVHSYLGKNAGSIPHAFAWISICVATNGAMRFSVRSDCCALF